MLELYHFDRSTAAQKVRISFAEKGLEWTGHYIDTSLAKRDQHDPEYLMLNPRGVVPTLIHDDRVIRESQIILEYLEDVFPEPPLRPADPHDCARMRLWTKRVDEGLHVDSRTVGQCIAMRFAAREADPALVKRHYEAMPEEIPRDNDLINNEKGVDSPILPGALRRFKRIFHEIDSALAASPWLAAEIYSLADISLVVYVSHLDSFQMTPLWEDLERLRDWQARIK